MMIKNNAVGVLKKMAVAGFFGAFSIGVSQGAVIISIDPVTGNYQASGSLALLSSGGNVNISDEGALSTGSGWDFSDESFTNASGTWNVSLLSVAGITVAYRNGPTLLGSSTLYALDQFDNKLWFRLNTDPGAFAVAGTGETIVFSGQGTLSAGDRVIFAGTSVAAGTNYVTNYNGDTLTITAAVPEPSGVLLGLSGLGLLVLRRERRG